MMKSVSFVALCVVALAVVLFSCGTHTAEAATCDVSQLSSCSPAFSGMAPSSTCCSKLKEQQPCFCGYTKNPNLRQFVNSPNAKKILSTCNVPYPNC